MALDKFQPYLFVSAGEQSNKFLTPSYSGGIASFQAQRAQSLTGLTVRIDPIQEGTGDPSPENIRPISGRTGLTVTRAGKNLFPSKTLSMGGTNQRTVTIDLPYTIPAGEYIMSFTAGGTGTGGWGIQFFYNSTAVGQLNTNSGRVTISATANRIYAYMAQNDYSAGYTRIIDNIQLELGTVATAYTPYVAPTTYPITWQTEAGTIYGGTLDVVSGVLTVDWDYIASYDGETLPGEWISDRDVYAEGTTPTTGAEVAYKLAEPVTYQLDPEQIMTLPGFNQIYSDAGPVIDIKF